ncbi:hypothetical protein [Nonomuraea sp. NPDC048826]|uniref:hypothetical protein n=1 Tax=Nonomuraea sp. NPDC048826 TaxID=3364347 RepID=UPI00370F9425
MNRIEQAAQADIPAMGQGVLGPLEYNKVAPPTLTPVILVAVAAGATICVAQKACNNKADLGVVLEAEGPLTAERLVEARRSGLLV